MPFPAHPSLTHLTERFSKSSLGTALTKRLEAKGALPIHQISDFLMFPKSSSQSRLCVLDCLTGARAVVNKYPFTIGSNQARDLQLTANGAPGILCLVKEEPNQQVSVTLSRPMVVDGVSSETLLCGVGEERTAADASSALAFRHTTDFKQWMAGMTMPSWMVYDRMSQAWAGPFDLAGLRSCAAKISEVGWEKIVVLPVGMQETGFFIKDLRTVLGLAPRYAEPVMEVPPAAAVETAEKINHEYGEFTCPICWFKFDRGDVMNIAVHATLRGDSVLGENQMQRFYATRFNDRNQALDAMGLPTADLACPHCRRKLPPGFLEVPHYIFSVVGAPSSGKSYYLSALVKMLQDSLFRNFDVSFRDADPSENVILTQMKRQLFSAGSPQDAYLAKTDLEGALYETLPRQGRKVRLPKPFVFKMSQSENRDSGCSVVFYDNAGEHFEPTSNSADSPGAQHIAVASGIFFLFDPLSNTDFKNRLSGITDPQLGTPRLDQQDVILAETEVRIKNLLGLHQRDRIATPLAVMIGKCDTWARLMGSEPMLPVIVSRCVSHANIKANSARLRTLLLDICPVIVANAEAISSNVRYFAISPLGSSPVEFTDREGHVRIGPDPKSINPRHVEEPSLWVLSQAAPAMVPSAPTF